MNHLTVCELFAGDLNLHSTILIFIFFSRVASSQAAVYITSLEPLERARTKVTLRTMKKGAGVQRAPESRAQNIQTAVGRTSTKVVGLDSFRRGPTVCVRCVCSTRGGGSTIKYFGTAVRVSVYHCGKIHYGLNSRQLLIRSATSQRCVRREDKKCVQIWTS